MSDYDIKYHSGKAELYGYLQLAIRGYLSNNIDNLSPDAIVNLAEELRANGVYQQREEKRAEEYRAQAEIEANPSLAIDAEFESTETEEATTL